jgi:hypothetical protein
VPGHAEVRERVDGLCGGNRPEETRDLLKPSASAFFANARYFRFAWLSPANAAIRLLSVDIMTPV